MMFAEKPRILVVDDEPSVLAFMQRAVQNLGFDVVAVESGGEGLARYSEDVFDLVLVDLKMDEMDGIEVIRQLKARDPEATAVVITAYGSIESAVEAMRAGAVDYLTKPVDLDHLELVILRVLENRRQSAKLRLLEAQMVQQESFQGLVGVSSAMVHIYGLIRRLSSSDTTVLIQGETGTGKELVARALHDLGSRQKAGFIPINCGALPETLLESELFGHEKGAFTGAVRHKYGLIEQADGGTLFLDEIEEMSPALQVKLLRAIQEREVLRVGGERPISVDFRLIAATNDILRDLMEKGAFRSDLYYRLSVSVVDLPPLRARGGDIALLARHFLAIYAEKAGRAVPDMAPETLMQLNAYRWPGNVRELENAIEQAVLFSDGGVILPAHLPDHIAAPAPETRGDDLCNRPLREARDRFERRYLEAMLEQTGWNVSQAARRAGINRQHFYEKMKRYDLSRG